METAHLYNAGVVIFGHETRLQMIIIRQVWMKCEYFVPN